MALFAFRNGVSTIDETTMNSLLAAQPSSLIFDGTQVDAKTGSGNADWYDIGGTRRLALRFTMVGQTTIGRIELHIVKYGQGSDLTIEIRDSTFNPDGSNDGALLKAVKFPAKLFPSSANYVSLPIDLSGLTSGAVYWIIVKGGGDSTNQLRLIGESTQDPAYPAYWRWGDSGAWTAMEAKHFKVFANTPGTYTLRHGIYGSNAKTTINYDGNGNITEIWRWLQSADGVFQICDRMVPTYDVNGMPVRWDVQ